MKQATHHPHRSQQRQQGAVAIIVGFCIFVLVGMLALVIDLAHLYTAKTELQNAADAAALSGAKELNGTLAGINNAVTKAVETAGKNNFDLNKTAVTISAANIAVGTGPADADMVPITSITSNALAADKTFLKVDTGPRSLDTWFARIWDIFNTQTFGMAVAGKYTVDIAPMGVCAINGEIPQYEYGFIRGVAYNIPDLNPLGVPAVPLWVNPVDTPPAACSSSHASNSYAVPFVCTGRSAINPSATSVYVSTGTQAALNKAMNVRFAKTTADYNGTGCDSASAPPAPNIKEYCAYDKNGCLDEFKNGAVSGPPGNWMEPDPVRQTVWFGDSAAQTAATLSTLRTATAANAASAVAAWRGSLNNTRWGVLWSNSAEKNYTTGGSYAASDWPSLYNGITRSSTPTSFPYVASGAAFYEPPSLPSKPDRRILNIVIIDCPEMSGSSGMSCQEIPVLGIGRFFMQKKADIPAYLAGEFVGMIPKPYPPSEIRLYR